MKKVYLLYCLFFLSFGAASQTNFGIKVGVNLVDFGSGQATELSNDFRPRFSIQAGGFLNRQFTEKGSFQLELLFFGKGFKVDNNFSNTDDIVRLNYLSIPAYYTYTPSSKVGVSFGFELSYLLKAQVDNADGTVSINDDIFDKLDLGGMIGLRFQLVEPFYIDLRYTHGLLQVVNLLETKFNNMALAASLGYRF